VNPRPNKETKEGKEFWEFVEKTAAEVKNRPEWMNVSVTVSESQAPSSPASVPSPQKKPKQT
jgi:hypothetical protein